MKMAKASEADINMAMALCSDIESLISWSPTVPEAIEEIADGEESEQFDRDNLYQCQRVLGYLLDLAEKASLMRVIWGCAVMLDPANELVDPNADSIEHHPKRQQLEQQRDTAWQELREIREAITANSEESTVDEVRRVVAQRDELLAALTMFMENIDEPEDRNCSCHISPPCNDCVENSGLRDAFYSARTAIAKVEGAKS